MAKEIHYNADGTVAGQIAFERNEDGLEIRRITMDAQGNVKSSVVTSYNEDGSSTRTKYDAEGKEIR